MLRWHWNFGDVPVDAYGSSAQRTSLLGFADYGIDGFQAQGLARMAIRLKSMANMLSHESKDCGRQPDSEYK